MRVALVGPPLGGKTTLFEAACGGRAARSGAKGGLGATAVVQVPDPRMDWLSGVYKPAKTAHATVEFHDLPGIFGGGPAGEQKSRIMAAVREAEALLAVVGMYDQGAGLPESADADRELAHVKTELALSDLEIIERRLEKLAQSILRRRPDWERDRRESVLLERLKIAIESETVASVCHNAEEETMLRTYRFLSTKPTLAVYNLDEERFADESFRHRIESSRPGAVAICARIEREIAELPQEEQAEFLGELGLSQTTSARLIAACYKLLNAISFLTIGADEVRAWTIRSGDNAVTAADKIHTDIARGFIRAEVVPFDDVKAHGGFKQAKAAGRMRLEGKEYIVRDGDVIEFRFSV